MRRGFAVVMVMSGLLAAATAWAGSPREEAAKLQKKLATDKKAEVRADAARRLGDLGAWDAVPALAAALEDRSDEVRAAAAYALVKLKDHARPAVPALERALDDPEMLVRYNAVVALLNLDAAPPAKLAGPIASLMGEVDEDGREAVVRMLVGLGLDDPAARRAILDAMAPEAPLRLQVMRELWHQDTLERPGPAKAEVVRQLLPMVSGDPDPQVRREAIVLLWRAKDFSRPVTRALVAALDDPDPEVRGQAGGTLNGIEKDPPAPAAIAGLTRKLKSADPEARAAAAQTLGSFIGWRHLFTGQLTALLLQDPEVEVRLAVVAALKSLADDGAIPAQIQAFTADRDARVRVALCAVWADARLALARTGHLEEVLRLLEQAQADAQVRSAAEAALAELRR